MPIIAVNTGGPVAWDGLAIRRTSIRRERGITGILAAAAKDRRDMNSHVVAKPFFGNRLCPVRPLVPRPVPM